MKIFIVHASAGAGHTRPAQAVYNYFKKNCPQHDCRLVDVLGRSHTLFKVSYRWGYSFIVRRAVRLWEFLFWITNSPKFRLVTRRTALFNNIIHTMSFARFLLQEDPEVIISTHFLGSEIAAFLKRRKLIHSRIITVVTDFGVHPFWIAEGTDEYVVACGKTREALIRNGVPQKSILELGIPVEEAFTVSYDRAAVCAKLGIEKGRFTVLLMTGSFGLGPLEKIAEMLHKYAQVLVICARNKSLFKRLTRKRLSQVTVLGFVDNIPELMAVSDLIITKAGGSTLSEILNMELVPIFISVIPGQEEANVELLSGYGIGSVPGDLRQLKNLVIEFINHPDRLSEAKRRARDLKRSSTSKDICNAVCQDSCRPAG